jgi:hypothetical protein
MPMGLEVEPAVGIEPTTHGLQNRCSAAELSWPELEGISFNKVRRRSTRGAAEKSNHPAGFAGSALR